MQRTRLRGVAVGAREVDTHHHVELPRVVGSAAAYVIQERVLLEHICLYDLEVARRLLLAALLRLEDGELRVVSGERQRESEKRTTQNTREHVTIRCFAASLLGGVT